MKHFADIISYAILLLLFMPIFVWSMVVIGIVIKTDLNAYEIINIVEFFVCLLFTFIFAWCAVKNTNIILIILAFVLLYMGKASLGENLTSNTHGQWWFWIMKKSAVIAIIIFAWNYLIVKRNAKAIESASNE